MLSRGARTRRMQTRASVPPQVKLVHVIRHGQAEHNVDEAALEKRNTRLTSEGEQQAALLKARVAALKPEVIVTSPILRALQTTSGFLTDEVAAPVVVVPDARERVSHKSHLCELPVDPSSARDQSSKIAAYDWSLVESSLALAGGSVGEWEKCMMMTDLAGMASIGERAARLTSWIESRPEETMVLVSHGAFLMRLTKDSYMDNCELRTYHVEGGKWTRKDRVSITNAVLNAAASASDAARGLASGVSSWRGVGGGV